jgi:hypothetical protein
MDIKYAGQEDGSNDNKEIVLFHPFLENSELRKSSYLKILYVWRQHSIEN